MSNATHYCHALRSLRLRIAHLSERQAAGDRSDAVGVRLMASRLALAALEVCADHGVQGLVWDRVEQDKNTVMNSASGSGTSV